MTISVQVVSFVELVVDRIFEQGLRLLNTDPLRVLLLALFLRFDRCVGRTLSSIVDSEQFSLSLFLEQRDLIFDLRVLLAHRCLVSVQLVLLDILQSPIQGLQVVVPRFCHRKLSLELLVQCLVIFSWYLGVKNNVWFVVPVCQT